MSVPFSSRLAGICAGVAACAALLGAAPAMATVTSSTITSVTTPDGFSASPVSSRLFSGWDGTVGPNPTTVVSGTVTTDDNFAADTVAVRCYYRGGLYDPIDSNVPVNPDGTFTSSPSTFNDETCRMAAVDPSYSDPIDLAKFRGPVYGVGNQWQNVISGGPNDGKLADFFSDGHQANGYMEWDSVGDCGITWSQVFTSTFYDSGYYSPLDCAGAMYTGNGTDGYGRSEMQVDGKNAVNTYGALNLNNYNDGTTIHYATNNDGFPALTWTNKVDPVSGDMTVTESEPLVFCGSSYPATAQCDPSDPYKFAGSGVHFGRAIKQSHDGLQATVTDTYTSTDGAAHSIDVEYDNYSNEQDEISYDVPGSGGYKQYYTGDSVELPAHAVGTVYVKDSFWPDGNPAYQIPGAFTYLTQPDRMFFNGGNASSYGEFVLQYRRTVPAGGSISITHIYTQGTELAGVRAMASQAEDAAQAPAVSIDSPADGSKVASSDVTVIGKASDDQGAPLLKVNGVPTSVQADGSWSQHLSLTPGSNTITAVASDKAGNTTQAKESVTYAAAAANCQVPNVVGLPTAQAVAGLQAANCAIGKQTATTSPAVRAGSVAAQNMAPGIIAANGTPVDIAVSTGVYSGAQLAKKTVRMRGRNVTIQVKCPGSSPVTNGTVKLRAVTGKHTTLGTRAFQCPQSGTRNVTFTLSKANARAIQGRGKSRVLAYIVSRGSTGEAATTRANLTVLPAK